MPHQYISRLLSTLVSAFDAPKIWNDLTDDVHSATSLLVQKDVEHPSLCKSIPALVSVFNWSFCMVLAPAMSGYMVMDLCFSVLCA